MWACSRLCSFTAALAADIMMERQLRAGHVRTSKHEYPSWHTDLPPAMSDAYPASFKAHCRPVLPLQLGLAAAARLLTAWPVQQMEQLHEQYHAQSPRQQYHASYQEAVQQHRLQQQQQQQQQWMHHSWPPDQQPLEPHDLGQLDTLGAWAYALGKHCWASAAYYKDQMLLAMPVHCASMCTITEHAFLR